MKVSEYTLEEFLMALIYARAYTEEATVADLAEIVGPLNMTAMTLHCLYIMARDGVIAYRKSSQAVGDGVVSTLPVPVTSGGKLSSKNHPGWRPLHILSSIKPGEVLDRAIISKRRRTLNTQNISRYIILMWSFGVIVPYTKLMCFGGSSMLKSGLEHGLYYGLARSLSPRQFQRRWAKVSNGVSVLPAEGVVRLEINSEILRNIDREVFVDAHTIPNPPAPKPRSGKMRVIQDPPKADLSPTHLVNADPFARLFHAWAQPVNDPSDYTEAPDEIA